MELAFTLMLWSKWASSRDSTASAFYCLTMMKPPFIICGQQWVKKHNLLLIHACMWTSISIYIPYIYMYIYVYLFCSFSDIYIISQSLQELGINFTFVENDAWFGPSIYATSLMACSWGGPNYPFVDQTPFLDWPIFNFKYVLTF